MQYSQSTRRVRVGEAPTISVLVTSTGPTERLATCLRHLEPACADLGAQLVVAHSQPGEDLRELRAAFPAVQFLGGPAGTTAADLRSLGLAGAEGDIVVIGEDDHLTADEIVDRFNQARRND